MMSRDCRRLLLVLNNHQNQTVSRDKAPAKFLNKNIQGAWCALN